MEYIAELCRLAAHCDFSCNSSYKDGMLNDTLRDSGIQSRRHYTARNLSPSKKPANTALAMKAAANSSRSIHQGETTVTVGGNVRSWQV